MKPKIWLVIKNMDKQITYFKYFETEYEKDKYKEKIKHIRNLMIIED